jgi:uncharacterized SAM-binding protein YcdF (DUF218 family)
LVRISRRGALALALSVILLLVILFHRVWLTWLGAYLIEGQQPFPADIIVVLGGDFRGMRILKGAELATQGYAPRVLVSGSGEVYGRHESDLAVEWAVAHGFNENLFIRYRYPATSTRDEAQAVVKELRRLGVRKFILVTSNFHTRRAAVMFHQAAPDLSFRVVSAADKYFTPDGWWLNREGQKTFFEEWSKTVAGWAGI